MRPRAIGELKRPPDCCCTPGRAALGAVWAGFERWNDCEAPGAVAVGGAALWVREPRLPKLEPLLARASAMAGASARTSAAESARARPAVRLEPR